MAEEWLGGCRTNLRAAFSQVNGLHGRVRRLPVKPSAQPTQVRPLDLPPPAKTARLWGILWPGGPFFSVSPCVTLSRCGPLCCGVHGHITDGRSTGQGASLAIESSIQLARCLRDLPDAASAFHAYERLRRDRVERITKRGARTNSAKTPGPAGRKAMRALMPIFFKVMNFEKVMGQEQRYQIDWDAPAMDGTSASG